MTRKQLASAIYDMETEYLGQEWSKENKRFHVNAMLNGYLFVKAWKKAELQERYDYLLGMGYGNAVVR